MKTLLSNWVTVRQVPLTEMLSPRWTPPSTVEAEMVMSKPPSGEKPRFLIWPISSTMPVKRDRICRRPRGGCLDSWVEVRGRDVNRREIGDGLRLLGVKLRWGREIGGVLRWFKIGNFGWRVLEIVEKEEEIAMFLFLFWG